MMVLVRIERWCCLAGMWIAGILLLSMVLLAGANVFFRLGGEPLGAIYELSSYLGALVVTLALADTQRKRGHVELDLFTRQYSVRARRAVGAFNMLAGAALMLLVSVQLWNRAGRLLAAGEVSETLKLPYPYLIHVAAIGLLLLACAFFTDFVFLLCRKDPDTEAYAQSSRKGVVSSIRAEIEE